MEAKTSAGILDRIKAAREKRAFDFSSLIPEVPTAAPNPSAEAFSGALQDMAAGQLKSDAGRDIRNMGVAALGVGAAGRGAVGLLQMLRAGRKKKTRSGPAHLPLPYPAEAKTAGVEEFAEGGMATSKSGIPWYGPAMLLGGLGGLGLGWKGMDKVLDVRRKREMDSEMGDARQQFHDALLAQYDEPIKVHAGQLPKKASDATMVKVGEELDALYADFTREFETEKSAVDWSNLAGQGAGAYGMYAGLSGLLTGALVYDKINGRSRRSVLDKALKKRQRRKFMQQPTEIYAVPEPVEA